MKSLLRNTVMKLNQEDLVSPWLLLAIAVTGVLAIVIGSCAYLERANSVMDMVVGGVR